MQRLPQIAYLLLIVFFSAARAEADDGLEFFEKKIRPVLDEHCYKCHGGKATGRKGELRLDLKAGWERGGESGQPAIVPGKPDESPLILAVRHDGDVSAMPPSGPRLSEQIIADLTTWVRMGAPDPRGGTTKVLDRSAAWQAEFRRRLDWWSLRPTARVAPPEVEGNNWSDKPIDKFVLAALRRRDLHPAPDADALTLVRRLSQVLTGLPPSPDMSKSFADRFAKEPNAALAAIVDDFLKSPHFGERMARHWMDVVRYTDTYGYEWDNPAKGSWEYRDYLIRAFNRDVGFHQLVREQIAGDLLATPRIDLQSGLNESLIGPMFYHMGEHRHGDNVTINGVREEMVDNKIDAFSKAFLAMTVACARCHDHKLDAISQSDYYALAGIFMTPRWTSRSIEAPHGNTPAIAELRELRSQVHDELRKAWAKRAVAFPTEVADAWGRSAYSFGATNRATNNNTGPWSKALGIETPIADAPRPDKPALGDIRHVTILLRAAKSDADARTIWSKLAAEWKNAARERREANQRRFQTLVSFDRSEFPKGWATDGDGMRSGYVSGGEPLIALEGENALQQLLPRGFHTHALSSKLAGALRLPPQHILPGKFVSVALAGGNWSGYLRVADNGFQTETVAFLSQPRPRWRTFADIAQSNGIQRVAYEITTSDLNPNFPPRTGLAKAGTTTLPAEDDGFDKRSWFSITGIVGHDQPGPPADDLQRFAGLFDGPVPNSAREAWHRIGRWLAQAVTNCESRGTGSDDVALVNWLLANDLLPKSLKDNSDLARLVHQYRQVEASIPFPRTANSMDERGIAPVSYALNVRGDINVRGDRVPRDFLAAFGDWHNVAVAPHSGRLQVAEFLVDPRHGIAARVFVNRVWQWVFGTGLVRTPNDFGHLGDQPSHPKLLDYLTHEFIANGWSTKQLIRRLVLTRTFRQSGKVVARAETTDPDNRWLHHYPTRRMEAESIRDALLATSGRLDKKLFGRPINPRRHVEDAKKRLFSGPLDGNGRRSIYLEVSIMDRSKFLRNFNAPDPKLPIGRRDITNVPAQALVMLNDPFVLAMAQHWASRLVKDGNQSVEARIQAIFMRALGRFPTKEESARWTSFVHSLSANGSDVLSDECVWRNTAHTLFNLQEFIHYR